MRKRIKKVQKTEQDKEREFVEWLVGLGVGFLLILMGLIFIIIAYAMTLSNQGASCSLFSRHIMREKIINIFITAIVFGCYIFILAVSSLAIIKLLYRYLLYFVGQEEIIECVVKIASFAV